MMGYDEIAAYTGVKTSTLRTWVQRGKMPKPDAYASRNAALWHDSTIKRWWEGRKK